MLSNKRGCPRRTNVGLDQMSIVPLCKVEFIQSFCWFYSVPNLLVIQYLEKLYLGGNNVRVVYERVCRNSRCMHSKESHDWIL